ncbi:cytochrome C biogenesis protein transmembrane region [bacterium BMS3Bbin11]|nr:cytochrome C biogenesis protein transmembrane region [bacterium BMS3Abin11]GBE46487.1 cytochrome C biogenesis protein transmembrane region [bacterium BMS3Bbin11]HDH07858.1 cytochrome c biogenesis protein CcdA [Gammaproteobacteria bacterium]HDH15076.1 cytochrome c biogenesis protein CcdA [Gammaproteobacteria bacterium]
MGAGDITYMLAVLAGLLSFLSPCVLPLMPVYLSYLTGVSVADDDNISRSRMFAHALVFVLGFSFIFILIGASMGLVFGTYLRTDFADILTKVGGVVLIILGIHMSRIIKKGEVWLSAMPRLYRVLVTIDNKLDAIILPERRVQTKHSNTPGYIRSGVVGVSFAAGWTPCIGPLLGAILTLAAGSTYGTDPVAAVMKSAGLLSAYSLGLAIPFLLTALLLGRATGFLKKINRHGHIIETISGVLLLIIGMLLLIGSISDLNTYFSATPEWLIELESKLLKLE